MNSRKLLLSELEEGLPGITERWGAFLAEAASYCLALKNHTSGVKMNIKGDVSTVFRVYWNNEINEQTQRSWNDTQELTEYGATAIALLLTVNLTEFTVIERAPKDGGGFDYWLGHKDSEIFENSARLEISGILEETVKNTTMARLKVKEEQVKQRESDLPVYIVVVEFSKPESQMVRK